MAVLIIDKGHGGDDPGAVHPDGKTREVDICHPAGNLLGWILKNLFKHEVLFTPVYGPDEKGSYDRKQRIAWANTIPGVALFVSLHADACETHSAEGFTAYYYHQRDKALAEKLAPAGAILACRNRGARKANFTVLTRATMPSVLLELGYVDDNDGDSLDDRKFLIDRLAEICGRLAVVIDHYLKGEK